MIYCSQCGNPLAAGSKFCSKCGATQASEQPTSPVDMPEQQPVPGKKRHTGCLVSVIVVLLIIAAGVFVFAKFAWLGPRDLGIRYDQDDLDSILQKINLNLSFDGMSQEDSLDYIAGKRTTYFDPDDYQVTFSDYQEMTFEATPEEVTAFANEVAAPFLRFEKLQTKIFDDKAVACSYRLRFDRIKAELIPDVAGQIPAQISNLLPDRFNLYTEGHFEIVENNFYVPEKLDRLDVGMISIQPLIGDMPDDQRSMVFDYAERTITQFPELVIHSLKVNDNGNFDVSAYLPTVVAISVNH